LMAKGDRQRYFLDGLLLKFRIEYDMRIRQVRESALGLETALRNGANYD
jgi:hypothetical protein